MTRFLCGFNGEFGLHLRREWYDGPYWELQVLNFFAIWNLDGLPYIFQAKESK